jgi:lysophospholipase L1-like esterase
MNRRIWLLIFFLLIVWACADDSASPGLVEEEIIEEEEIDEIDTTSASPIYLNFLALGDSYTIGQSVPEGERWPNQLANALNMSEYDVTVYSPTIIARTGWTTQDLKSAIAAENPPNTYNLVSLLIGVNNQYRGYPIEEYPSEFESLLQIAIDKAGGNSDNVIVLSIPDYGYTPFGESYQEVISEDIDEYNAINKELSEQYGIKYYDITPISRLGLQIPSLVASDNLHPSAEQYSQWVDLIMDDVERLISPYR